ncbi:hypothetical protein [Treponema brennaborense]|uniref:Uncharacterized protein n=1 Tax=Treponema brennaborense (strain DSM 12168 / CIP 105900 / DD5/3) TaxID=906968 RepID=F4LMZ0_TREBD|nr:hypothetical protein [Treponema brennaborense]AEE15776.1 hypothetical protein Trebr_0329 [Treponema brennaborense DSM 12168]
MKCDCVYDVCEISCASAAPLRKRQPLLLRQARTTRAVVLIAAALLAFVSCSPSLSVAIADGGGVACSFEAYVPDSIAETVRSFGDLPSGVPLFDAPQIRASLVQAGFTDVAVAAPSASAVTVKAAAKSVAALLPQIPGAVAYTPASGKDAASVTVSLTPDVLQQMLALLPAETRDYADLLSAPVFTGERMDAAEYTDLIGAVYGKTMADELARGVLNVSVSVPRAVIAAFASSENATVISAGKTVRFGVPLAEFLTQSEKIEFCVRF